MEDWRYCFRAGSFVLNRKEARRIDRRAVSGRLDRADLSALGLLKKDGILPVSANVLLRCVNKIP